MANPKPGPHIPPPGHPSQYSCEPATGREVESVADIGGDIFHDTQVKSDAPSSPPKAGSAPGQTGSRVH